MSVSVMSHVFAADLKTTARNGVMLGLADAASDDGTRSYRSRSSLGKMACCDPRTVTRICAQFVDEGLIDIVGKGPKGTVHYTLNVEAIKALKYRQADRVDTLSSGHCATSRVDTVPPEPSINHPTTTANVRERVLNAIGNAAKPNSQKMAIIKTPLSWTMGANACDFEQDLIPTLERLSAHVPPQSIGSWNYYRSAVFEARDLRIAEPNNPPPKDLSNDRRNNKSSKPDAITTNRDRRREVRLRVLEQRKDDRVAS